MTGGRNLAYAYFGSGAFAARCLELLSSWRPPAWVVTALPKPAGRGKQPTPTPVGALVREHPALAGIPLLETASASSDEDVLAMRERLSVVFCFVVDFGQWIREPLLDWDGHPGCLNIHPSLLPRYRGAAPVQRALMDGETQTGVTIFKLASGMDAGPVLLQEMFDIENCDDAGTLLERAAVIGTAAFIDCAEHRPPEEWHLCPQDEALATRAPKIAREEERIDWHRTSHELWGQIRALSPKPGAWTTFRDKRLKIMGARPVSAQGDGVPGELLIWEGEPAAATGDGVLVLSCLQAEGKTRQSAGEWWNGVRAEEGARLQ